MLKKEIKVKIKLEDFIQLLNSGKFQIDLEDLKFIRSQVDIKPILKDSIISVSKENLDNSLKTTLNNHSLTFQLC